MAEVHLQEGETLESALRRFKRKVLQADIIKETKRHSFYLKPGEEKAREIGAGPQAESQEAHARRGCGSGSLRSARRNAASQFFSKRCNISSVRWRCTAIARVYFRQRSHARAWPPLRKRRKN